MTEDMRNQLLEVYNLCMEFLPEQVTLDFVSFDGELFRLINGINSREKEVEIEKKKYPLRELFNVSDEPVMQKKIFQDTEDIREISEDFSVHHRYG